MWALESASPASWKTPATFIDSIRPKHRLAFDSIILLPKNFQNEPKENLKPIFKIKNDLKNIFEDKRVVTKILKMDENNQYGNAMTKPLPRGSSKKRKKDPNNEGI